MKNLCLFFLVLAISGCASAPRHAFVEPDFSETDMESQYDKVLARLTELEATQPNAAAAKNLVITAQATWNKFRTVDCRAEAALSYGAYSELLYIGCMKEHSDKRRDSLESYYNSINPEQ